jgi:hypothetical protein
MAQITELFNVHFAEADYKVLFGNFLIIIGVCTILFFALVETEPDVEVPAVETKKADTPKRVTKKGGLHYNVLACVSEEPRTHPAHHAN